MIPVSEIVKETLSDILDENGENRKAIPVFKKQFVKSTKDLWEMFDNSTKFSNRELVNKIDETMLVLAHLKHNIREYSKDNAETIDDWV
jgi:hypothetical protein